MRNRNFNIIFSLVVFVLSVFNNSKAQDFEDPHAYLNWKQIETEHFFVNFHPGAENTAKIISKIAEEVFPAITEIYNHKPDTKVSFIIKDYSDNSNGAAYYFDNKIEIWASSMDFDLRGTHNWLRNVITHEFTHIIQLQTAMKFGRRIPALYFQMMNYESERRPDVLYGFPNVLISYPIPGAIVPAWFAEGVAQYNNPDLQYDFFDSHRDMIMRMYALDNNMLSWEDMGVFGKTSLGNESSYNAGFSIISYISETYGFEKVKEISYNMSKLSRISIDDAIYSVLGKTGKEIYEEWKSKLKNDYTERIQGVQKNTVAGNIIGKVGFGNFYPTFSPDGGKIAYTSNKEADYFSLSSIYLYDLEKGIEEMIITPVRSELSFSSDGTRILYSRYDEPNTKDEIYQDLFEYDLKLKEEKQITKGLRAYSPEFSPDGKNIAFLSQKDGTVNLYLMDYEPRSIKQLTDFKTQEQLYNIKYSPDGKQIVFCYSVKDGRDIGVFDLESKKYKFILESNDDERNPVYSKDGKYIYYSSDKTGIFNIYRYELASGKIDQITNVLGGAFMPSENKNGDLVFSTYTSSGYKISTIKDAQPINNPNNYIKRPENKKEIKIDGQIGKYRSLNTYNDQSVPEYKSKDYKNIFGSMSFFPLLRLDNYNKNSKGLDILKPGIYFMSSDVLDKYSIFGGASINRKFERDLYLIFDYNDKLPLLYNLGITPKLSLELYNISRKTSNNAIQLGENQVLVDVGYSMFEFDISATHKIFNSNHMLKLLYRFSMYSSSIGSFILPETNELVQASGDDYFLGSDIGIDFSYKGIIRSKTSEINPIGTKVRIKFDYEMDRFNSDGEYEIVDGFLKPKYHKFRFPKIEAKLTKGITLPFWSHSLSVELHGGTIIGPPINEFFNSYIGGFPGMKGYPFYGLGGNDFARMNLAYRFPISDDLDFRLLQIYFDKLYASFFFDYGNAWTDGTKLTDFKKDAGLELRLETFSWYAYPTRIFASAAYGFDSFGRTFYEGTANEKVIQYGKEWRFYLGVLFGFEIFDQF